MPRGMQGRYRSRSTHGFTVVEMLVAVLILAAFMAIALPLFLSAIANGQRKQCRDNMQAIANAEREYKLANYPSHTYAPDIATLQTKTMVKVACPTNGAYSITLNPSDGSGTFTVHCSVAAHDAGDGVQPAGYTPNVNTE